MQIIFLKVNHNHRKGDIVSCGGVMAAAMIKAGYAKEYHKIVEPTAEEIKASKESKEEKEKLDAEKKADDKKEEKKVKDEIKKKADEVLAKAATNAKKAKTPSQMNKAELTELAKEVGVEVNDEMTNKQMIAAIKAKK